MRYTFSLFLLLIAFWAVNSAYYTGLLLFLCLVSSVLVLMITHRMRLVDQESLPLHLITRIGPFYCWLIKEIVVGAIYVLRKILQGDNKLSPRVITLKLDFRDELSKVIFANSITLVPGTLTLKLDKDSIQVHALTEELAEALISGELVSRIKRLEN